MATSAAAGGGSSALPPAIRTVLAAIQQQQRSGRPPSGTVLPAKVTAAVAALVTAAILNRLRNKRSSTDLSPSSLQAYYDRKNHVEGEEVTEFRRTSSFAAIKDFAVGLTPAGQRRGIIHPIKPAVFEKHYKLFPPVPLSRKVAFCDTLSSLYCNLGKPILDTVIFNYQLTRSIGLSGMLGLLANYFVTASVLRAVTPAFGRMAATEAMLEGDFRAVHARLIMNAEEVGFYNGAELEKSILNRAYQRLIRHVNSLYKIRIAYNMFEDFVIKYCWSAVGLLVCAVPVFFPKWAGLGGKLELDAAAGGEAVHYEQEVRTWKDAAKNADDSTSTYSLPVHTLLLVNVQHQRFSRRLMISLADAGGRLMYSYKELAELAGHTFRVYTLISVLHQLHRGVYSSPAEPAAEPSGEGTKPFYTLDNINGKVIFGHDGIRLDGVPIVTPNPSAATGGEELVRDLEMDVKPGEHLMITGPNGVGKVG
ncbi:MAG: ABC transporter transmembrane region 2-domain-containing protein [Olpidium bornovanus]|uniref:ABC transporter transmembrane region 2-domain-containing protein n=1 Tax=Olpidium bornovanus TaxID=278681 RepID=A0A8H8DKJ6_9FUNG|nr:MAG: ABC transporter transmembrane region 2-domain-containing protein [Olpidium bornovanus]